MPKIFGLISVLRHRFLETTLFSTIIEVYTIAVEAQHNSDLQTTMPPRDVGKVVLDGEF